MKKVLKDFLRTKWAIGLIAISVLVVIISLPSAIGIGASGSVQRKDNNIENNNVNKSYSNGETMIKNNEKIKHESAKDPATGKEVSSTDTQYFSNGKVKIKEEYHYDSKTGTKTSLTRKIYGEKENLIQENEYEFDPNTGNMTSQVQTAYQTNGDKSYTNEFRYSSGWEMPTSSVDTQYFNGKIISKTEEAWDVNTHKKIHSASAMYDSENGNISSETEENWDANTENMIRSISTQYSSKDGSIKNKEEKNYNPKTGNMTSKIMTDYDSEGYYTEEYYFVPEGDYPTNAVYTEYDKNNKVIKKEKANYDPKTGERIN